MKTAILLSGCGVYDGTEIHESVFVLLALSQRKMKYICVAPNIQHHHVVNHVNGKEMKEERNVLNESARIARGNIMSLSELNKEEISSLIIPGGFGVAKNLSNWAFEGLTSTLNQEVKDLILHCIDHRKPIVSLCISPVLIAKCLEDKELTPKISLGSKKRPSEYDISEIHKYVSLLGSQPLERTINEICIDEELKIISAPCYMMDVEIHEVFLNITMAIDKLKELLD